MERKPAIWIGMTAGSFIGGYVPSLWNSGVFSLSGILFTAIGGFVGIWLGYTYGQ